jgi:hypothetical protein
MRHVFEVLRAAHVPAAAAPAAVWVDICVCIQLQQPALLQVALHHCVDASVRHLHTRM